MPPEPVRAPKTIAIGEGFELDPRSYQLWRAGRLLKLERIPMEILLLLVERPGELITREEIAEKVWGKDVFLDTDNSINGAIRKLRRVLKDNPERPRFVQTITGRGYRFVAAVPEVGPARGASPAQIPAAAGPIGKRISHYRVLQVLGGGGIGAVYKAEDLKLGRAVAIKFLPAELANDPRAFERFEREARAASALDHPSICSIYELGEYESQPFIVMQLLEGQTLREWIETRTGQYSAHLLDQILDIARQVLEGLETAHDRGIIHRDIKPANIFVTTRGEAKILDFGVAKVVGTADRTMTADGVHDFGLVADPTLTRTRGAIGTPFYLSPEQVRGDASDRRTDLFSFGLVLFEMATGTRAFDGETAPVIRDAVLHRPAPTVRELRPELPAELERIVDKALQKDRDRRYQSASEIRADILRLQRGREDPADRDQFMPDPVIDVRRLAPQTEAAAPSLKKFSRGWRWVAPASVLLAIVVGFVLRMDVSRSRIVRQFQYEQLTHFADSAVSPSFSADGRMLTFIRGPSTFTSRGEIYVQTIPGGEPVQLTHDGAAGLPKMNPVFLPGSLQIAYTILGSHHAWNTWIVPALGGGEPRLMLANASGMTWIEVGGQRRIMFSEYKGIGGVHMGIVTSTESRSEERDVYVPTSTEGMAHRSRISPDGKQVLVAEMERTNWLPCRLTPYDGSSAGKPVGPSPAHCTDGAWSPDGKWMYFAADTGKGFHIWRQRFPDGSPEQVTFGVTEEEGIAFAPDGRSFATSIGSSQSTVWIHDARGERQISSRGYAYHPSFSVDGKKLYYLVRSDRSRHYESGVLYVADLESGSHDLLLPNFLMQTYDIASDGKRVVFIGEDDTGRTPVWLAPLDGRTPPRILSSINARNAYFAGHDDVIFLGEEQPGRTFLYRVHENGRGLQKLAKSDFLYGVSPDGKWVSSWEEGPTEETRNSVVVRPVDGGPAITMCGTCAAAGAPYAPPIVTWSRDQKYLYAHAVPPVGRPQGASNSPATGGTYALPIPTGESVPRFPASGLHDAADLAALPGARVVAPAGVFTGTDPAVFAFQRVTTQRNIYRVRVP